MSDYNVSSDIIEGFLCPICKADLKSPDQLTSHFETLHKEDQDVLKSLKQIFGKAKKKILNLDEKDIKETFDKALKVEPEFDSDFFEPQEIGCTKNSSEYFRAIRSAKLDRYTAETNKLLIRLDKLLANMPNDPAQRKAYEQDIVPWLDGSSVKLCPGCAKNFNFARRQHHCRLCGSLICNDCSCFFDLNVAKCMIDPTLNIIQLQSNDNVKNGLRMCEHCYKLIELRKQLQENRNSKTILVTGYEQMRSLMEQASPAVAMYLKMCTSLKDGETTYNLTDTSVLKMRIAKYAEGIDSLSKQISSLQIAPPGSQTNRLQIAIRQAATQFIKQDLVTLPPVPSEAEINEIRRMKQHEAERRVEHERRQAQINLAKRSGDEQSSSGINSPEGRSNVFRNEIAADDENNPLVEQMNIIRGYIKQARAENKLEEVKILENNLRELKFEYQTMMSQFTQ